MNKISQDKTINRIVYLLFCLSVLTVPVNIAFFSIIRLSDVFITTSFIIYLTSNPSIKSIHLMIFSTFFGLMLLSSVFSLTNSLRISVDWILREDYEEGLLRYNGMRLTGMVFYYKYSLLFIIPLIVTYVVNSRRRINHAVSILFYVYMSLVIWVFIYYFLRINDEIQGSVRVSFPFSNYIRSDAHLYSSYLAFTFVGYNEYLKKVLNHGIIFSYLICILSVVSIIMTGSKTGTLILLIYSVILTINFLFRITTTKIKFILVTLFILFIGVNLGMDSIVATGDTQELFARATRIFVGTSAVADAFGISYGGTMLDRSITTRFLHYFTAFYEIAPSLLLLGNGPTGSIQKWYDGGISVLLAHGGLLGLFTFAMYIGMIVRKTKKMSIIGKSAGLYKIFILLLLTYILINIITEFFLITRNLLPIATLLSLIYVNIKLNYIDSSTPHLHQHV